MLRHQPSAGPDTPETDATGPAVRTRDGNDAGPSNKPGVQRPRPEKPLSASMAPIKPDRWGFDQARHLLLRAGFGGSPAQVRTIVEWGPQKAVDHLVNFESVPFEDVRADLFDADIMRPLNAEERGDIARARRSGDEESVARLRAMRQEAERVDREQMRRVQRWWLKRMIETPRPLEEKMTLFWHGHFATSYRTIEDSYHMFKQNRLFRSEAVGSFGKLLYEIIRDPAMIAYLDNNDSRKGRPNENLARELLELFGVGVGNYTEKDIKEGARALTGYTFSDDEFSFQQANHDTGAKAILGRTGRLDGDGFVTAILEHPACPRFIAGKLYRFFVANLPTGRPAIDRPAETVIRELASTMVANRYQIKPVLKKLFLSEHFYQPAIMREQIKSPTELVVGSIRGLNTPARDLGSLADAMNLMGQNLFFPPSVKGWDGGRSWINTATLFIRQNILCFLLTGKMPHGFDPLASVETFDAEAFIRSLEAPVDTGATDQQRAAAITDALLRFTLGAASPENSTTLMDWFATRRFRLDNLSLTGALLLVTAMPEYQLC